MALSNEQYEALMREYSKRQSDARADLALRRENAYKRVPRLKSIDEAAASLSVAKARQLLSGNEDALFELKHQLQTLASERTRQLLSAGFPEDYLSISYSCPDCQDTGYIDNRKCHCFRQAEIDLLYAQSNLREILKRENFSVFQERYYSDKIIDPATGKSSLELARNAYKEAIHFTHNFGSDFSNLFLYGNTGIGKTFLTNCIARELLDRSWSVIYFSSTQLFDLFARYNFSKTEDSRDFYRHIFDCDLLIIDDLGTELVNAFVSSQLFQLINERLLRRKSVVISTNLTPEQFMNTYSERIFSRITSNYTMLKLYGDDIRLKKKFLNHHS